MFAKIPLLLTATQFCLVVVAATYTTSRLGLVSLNRLVNKDRFQPQNTETRSTTPTPLYVELPLNHLDTKSGTFFNRYWVDDTFYKPGGPVFFIDNGEASANGMEVYLRKGASGSLAETFNGLLILWEHRFYGTSMPSMTKDMKFKPDQLATYLQYHTVEQALEDIVVFAKSFNFSGLPNQDLTAGTTPWVFIGGSYPGARAAWARSRNPDIIFASLASSAVVQIQENLWEYYIPVEKTMDGTGYANCSSDMRALSAYLNNAFDTQDATAVDNFMLAITGPPGSDLYRYFNFDNTTDQWNNRRVNLRAAIEVMFQDFQYVGMAGFLGGFCDLLQMEARQSKTSPLIQSSAGIFKDFGLKSALNTYAKVLAYIWGQILSPSDYPAVGYTINNVYQGINCASSAGIAECQHIITQYSWDWQVCTEIGAFQVVNASRPESLLPNFESVDNAIKDCVTYFGKTVSNGPNVGAINTKYKGWNMNPTNVMWNDGELDPWRSVTLHSTEDLSPKRPSTTDIPANGKNVGGNSFFGYLVPGGFHCPDLSNVTRISNITTVPDGTTTTADVTTAGANTAHTLFINALNSWLPVFEKHTVSNVSKLTPSDVPTNNSSRGNKHSGAAGNMVSFSSVLFFALMPMIVYSVL